MTSGAPSLPPPRACTGVARRLRVLGVVALYAVLASGILFTTGTLDRTQGFAGPHLLPFLLGISASLVLAPPARERATPRDLLPSLGLAAGVGATVALLVATSSSRSWWPGTGLVYADLMLGLRRFSPVALSVAALSSAAAAIPLLVVRRQSGELEWQVLGGVISGLGALLVVATDALLEPRLGLLGALVPFGVLGAGSFVADRWVGRGRARERRRPRSVLRLLALLLLSALTAGLLGHTLTGVVLRGSAPLRRDVGLEEALLDLQGALNARREQRRGGYPSSLGELPGVAPELAAGLKAGYVIRYGRARGGWSLAADPIARRGEGWACYALTHDGILESSVRPFALRQDSSLSRD